MALLTNEIEAVQRGALRLKQLNRDDEKQRKQLTNSMARNPEVPAQVVLRKSVGSIFRRPIKKRLHKQKDV